MVYADINPVRACISEELVDSDFTSIQQRFLDYSSESDSENRLPQPIALHHEIEAKRKK